MFSSQYGWTTEQVLDLTMREISWRVRTINKRLNADATFRATLHNMKLTGHNESSAPLEIPESLKKAADAALEEAKLRVGARYGRR